EVLDAGGEVAGLDGAAGRVVLRVEVQHHPAPAQFAQLHLLVVLIEEREVRGLLSDGERAVSHEREPPGRYGTRRPRRRQRDQRRGGFGGGGTAVAPSSG